MQTIISDPAGWAVTSSGFVNATYLADTLGNGAMSSDATGFTIENVGSVVVAFEGTYTGQVLVHEQTLDRLGLTGWFPVVGQVTTSAGDVAPTSTGSTSGSCYVFPARGIRHRIRMTALASGIIIARVASETTIADLQANIVNTGTGIVAAQVQGNVAASTTDAGNPVKIGGLYVTPVPNYASGQRGDAILTSQGSLRVEATGPNYAIPDGVTSTAGFGTAGTQSSPRPLSVVSSIFNGTSWDRQRGDTNGTVNQRSLSSTVWNFASATGGLTTTADTIMSAATPGVRNYCTGVSFVNSAAVASEIVIKDGATTVLFRGYVPISTANTVSINFDVPLKGSVNTDMIVAMITTATATRVSAQGFQGA